MGKNFTEYEGLLEIAERFLMDDFKLAASLHIAKEIQLNKKNYVQVSQMAEKYRAKVLGEKCADSIVNKGIDVNLDVMESMPMVMVLCFKKYKEYKEKVEKLEVQNTLLKCTRGHIPRGYYGCYY